MRRYLAFHLIRYTEMTNNNHTKDDFDELDHDLKLDSQIKNKRISVRYRRNDIQAVLKTHGLFFSNRFPVELIDISSKGAAISCEKKLRKKIKVTLFVRFKDKRSFSITATVVHNSDHPKYGLKFDKYQGELAEHLLETQTDLEFG